MKILVTGATGYIGSHVCAALSDSGHMISAVDINWNQNNIDSVVDTKIHWDIRFKNRKIRQHYDAVIHLAALTMVEKSVASPLQYYRTNLLGTHNVIDNISCDHIIYCSTGAAFRPDTSPYAMSKRAAEDLISVLPNYSICRFYNVSGNDGFLKYESGYYHLLRKAAATANGLFDKFTIYGYDYDTFDGTAIRNYTHVADIVSAVGKIVENGPTKSIECLGNNVGYSVKQVISAMKSVSQKDFEVILSDRRPGDSPISVLPEQSRFFAQRYTLEDQCRSALLNERCLRH